jgi:hypothetical protein
VKAEWSRISSTDESEMYIDTGAIEKTGNNRRFWILQNFSEVDSERGKPVASTRDFVEIACDKRQYRILKQDWFSERWLEGKLQTPTKFSNLGEWDFVPPGTPINTMMKKLCPK